MRWSPASPRSGWTCCCSGPVPTPAVAMLTRSMRCDLGVMISASHNLFEDNGIKLFGPDGFKLSDDIEARIEDLLDGDIAPRLARAPNLGRAKRIDDVQARYIEYAKRTLPRDVSFDGLRVVARLRQRRRLQGRARGALGIGGRGHQDRRRTQRGQHQPRRRLHFARGARAEGAGNAGGHRHRARRRRRPRWSSSTKRATSSTATRFSR